MVLLVLVISLVITYFFLNISRVLLKNYKAQKFFSEKTPSLPALKNPNILTGNVLQTLALSKSYKVVDKLHDELGSSFGLYFFGRPWIATKDLDLIKKIQLDDGYKNVEEREPWPIPAEVFDHSISQASGQVWRQLRKALVNGLR